MKDVVVTREVESVPRELFPRLSSSLCIFTIHNSVFIEVRDTRTLPYTFLLVIVQVQNPRKSLFTFEPFSQPSAQALAALLRTLIDNEMSRRRVTYLETLHFSRRPKLLPYLIDVETTAKMMRTEHEKGTLERST